MKNLMTVALPLWKAGKIAWLAMESLCRQETTHPWELVVMEEAGADSFGRARVEDYKNCLSLHGCVSLRYESLKKWVTLGKKWRLLGDMADSNSIGFMLQAADCYSSPGRVESTARLILAGTDWVHSPLHAMYDLKTRRLVIYDVQGTDHTGSEMATRTEYIKALPCSGPSYSVDRWLLDRVKRQAEQKRKHFSSSFECDGNWHKALNVNGLNTISNRDEIFANPTGLFSLSNESLNSFVPKEIVAELDKLSDKLWPTQKE